MDDGKSVKKMLAGALAGDWFREQAGRVQNYVCSMPVFGMHSTKHLNRKIFGFQMQMFMHGSHSNAMKIERLHSNAKHSNAHSNILTNLIL